eukprot:scaffold264_cov317-Pinguiococcus_pyrenoidosus.AAC.35
MELRRRSGLDHLILDADHRPQLCSHRPRLQALIEAFSGVGRPVEGGALAEVQQRMVQSERVQEGRVHPRQQEIRGVCLTWKGHLSPWPSLLWRFFPALCPEATLEDRYKRYKKPFSDSPRQRRKSFAPQLPNPSPSVVDFVSGPVGSREGTAASGTWAWTPASVRLCPSVRPTRERGVRSQASLGRCSLRISYCCRAR